MLQKQKTILFFSNPFGYGPTTTLLHLAETLHRKTNTIMYIAGKEDGLCKEIFNSSNHPYLTWVNLNERDFNTVKNFISKFENPYVVSVLNRFSIEAASQLKVHNALIDFLAWFWTKPLREYYLSELYFYNSLGGKVAIPTKLAYDMPIILGEIPKKPKRPEHILINIGGGQNPIVEGIPTNYLTLLSKIIDGLDFKNEKVIIGGGKLSTEFLRKTIRNSEKFEIRSFSHEEFLKIHASSKHFISLSGTNATFMSFALGIPTTFLLPQLLAHWKLSFLLKDTGASDPLMWEDYFKVDDKMYSLTEYDVVPYTEKLSLSVLNSKEILDSIIKRIQKRLDGDGVNLERQTQYIDKLGVNGEDFVTDVLIKKWGLA